MLKVLGEWEKDKTKGKKDLGVVVWNEKYDPDSPLTEQEIKWLETFLEK